VASYLTIVATAEPVLSASAVRAERLLARCLRAADPTNWIRGSWLPVPLGSLLLEVVIEAAERLRARGVVRCRQLVTEHSLYTAVRASGEGYPDR
jgi:hypothetical protein